MDIYSLEAFTLHPEQLHLFPTGIAIEFDAGHIIKVMDKGGIAKSGVHALGGVFDAGYRGEYLIHLVNHSTDPFVVEKGQKIAQLVILPVVIADVMETDALSESARGEGRFGSTGKF